jgi:hypothetical protein
MDLYTSQKLSSSRKLGTGHLALSRMGLQSDNYAGTCSNFPTVLQNSLKSFAGITVELRGVKICGDIRIDCCDMVKRGLQWLLSIA